MAGKILLPEKGALIDYFKLPGDVAKKIRDQVILCAIPLPDTRGKALCNECDGSGSCSECGGTGEVNHECDCKYCTEEFDDCLECNASGKCSMCGGSGLKKDKAE